MQKTKNISSGQSIKTAEKWRPIDFIFSYDSISPDGMSRRNQAQEGTMELQNTPVGALLEEVMKRREETMNDEGFLSKPAFALYAASSPVLYGTFQ